MKKTLLLGWSAVLLSLGACEMSEPDYSAEMLLPLVKTRIKPENVNDIGEIIFKQDIVMPDVSHIIQNVNLPVPAFGLQNVGPISLIDEEDAFVRAKVDTAEYHLTITNNFPINIKAGTTVEITNTTNTDIVFTAVIPEDIAPYGGEKTITLFLAETSPWFDNDLRLYLRNFSSDGSTEPVDFNTYNNIRLRFDIELLRINEVEINQGKNYFLQDTVDFNVQDEDNFANLAEGKLTLFVKNGWPASYNFQGYFLDEQYQIVDSLLELSNVPSPEINSAGYVVTPSIQEARLETIMTRQELLNLRSRAKYLSFRARFAVPTPSHLPPTQTIKLRHENQVDLQLVGDLKVEVNP